MIDFGTIENGGAVCVTKRLPRYFHTNFGCHLSFVERMTLMDRSRFTYCDYFCRYVRPGDNITDILPLTEQGPPAVSR